MSASLIHFLDKGLLKKQEFIGNGTFNVPKAVTRVLLHGCGGGGGGSGSGGLAAGGAGGGGASGQITIVDVTPETPIGVVIGGGGAGASGNAKGGDGINSSFGSTLFPGAKGALPAYTHDISGTGFDPIYPASGGAGGTFGGDGCSDFTYPRPGGNSANYSGGVAPYTAPTKYGGGGGAGEFGSGGNGGVPSVSAPGGGATNTGAGGGGGVVGFTTGGSGGSGRVIVYWIEPE